MLESKIQEKTVALLESNGFKVKLIEYRGSRDCPDAMVFAMDRPGRVAFLELKTKKGRRSHGQINEASEYAIYGHYVGVPRTAEESLAHVRKVFYGEAETCEKQQRSNPENVRQVPRKKAVSRLSDSDDGASRQTLAT